MNIFWIEYNLADCAKSMCDKHVVKMALEYAQMLSTAHHIHRSPWRAQAYKITHSKHPCSVWVAHSPQNYALLYRLWRYTCIEYNYRYDRMHRSWEEKCNVLKNLPTSDFSGKLTPPPLCMPEGHKQDDIVQSYRNYYVSKTLEFPVTQAWTLKSPMTWKKRSEPRWFAEALKGRIE